MTLQSGLAQAGLQQNAALLAKVRAENPDAVILYKPHPDVEACLRPGTLTDTRAADMVLSATDTGWLLEQVQEVWTVTSTLGFEALLRGKAVTCLGAPFYAGWGGLTRDLGPVPARRNARPDLPTLAHAVLIAYPRYLDPVTRLPCSPELALERLTVSNQASQPPCLAYPCKGARIAGQPHHILALTSSCRNNAWGKIGPDRADLGVAAP